MSLPAKDLPTIDWRFSAAPVDYPTAIAEMEARVAAIRAGTAPELVWLLEHPPLYTGGTSAKPGDLLDSGRFPTYATGRGGQYTYHGPGQRVGYVMVDLKPRGGDVRAYVRSLEDWLIATLKRFNVTGERREGRIGIWVDRGPHPSGGRREDKIAALGVRVRQWVTYHGVALNVDCDLTHFAGIVPCGVATAQYGVTSLLDLGITATMSDVDAAMRAAFDEVLG
jgi:lipoyl(octanoyl) transferase